MSDKWKDDYSFVDWEKKADLQLTQMQNGQRDQKGTQ